MPAILSLQRRISYIPPFICMVKLFIGSIFVFLARFYGFRQIKQVGPNEFKKRCASRLRFLVPIALPLLRISLVLQTYTAITISASWLLLPWGGCHSQCGQSKTAILHGRCFSSLLKSSALILIWVLVYIANDEHFAVHVAHSLWEKLRGPMINSRHDISAPEDLVDSVFCSCRWLRKGKNPAISLERSKEEKRWPECWRRF